MSKIVERKEPMTVKELYEFASSMNVPNEFDLNCLMSMIVDVGEEYEKSVYKAKLFKYVLETVNDKTLTDREFRERMRGLVDAYKESEEE